MDPRSPPADASDAFDALAGAASTRSAVRCGFHCERSEGPWHTRRIVAREALSRPYRISVSLVTPNLYADPDELVGSPCDVTFDSSGGVRVFHGVAIRVQSRGRTRIRGHVEVLAVDVEIGPALTTLEQRINCRIFQGLTVPEIVRDVLLGSQVPAGEPAEGLAAFDRTVDDRGLQAADYQPPRDYCVQYRESDLDFVHRLLHEEGIVYTFDQFAGEREILTLIDNEAGLPAYSGASGVHLPVDAGAAEHTDAITDLVVERTSSPTRVASQHHNWLIPLAGEVRHAGLTATLGQVAGNDREVYLPSEDRIREVYEGHNVVAVHDDCQRRLGHALETLMGDEYVARGRSNAMGLAAGTVFEVDHAISQFERLVVLEVVHEISIEGDTLDVLGHYENNFVCVPVSRFRAATDGHPRPVMHGPQTATVTGPAGQDIHTDRFGRIKILMHWDREGYGRGRERRADATSSVWVPVMQTWAGTGWGAVFIPRVGMRVVVDFLAGNPDRPVVVGCLYDGAHVPPYPLPEQQTRSTLRTKSTPDNGGYNELRFEDAADQEEVYLRAQRDYNELVQRNHGTRVQVDQAHDVGGNRSRHVAGREQITIDGNRSVTVSGGGGEGFSGQSVKITQDYKLDVARKIHVKAPVEILIECEGSMITMTPNEIVLQAGGGAKMVLNEDGLVESNAGSRGKWDAAVNFVANNGGEVELDGRVRATAKDGGEVELTADAKITSNGEGHGLFQSEKVTVDSGDATVTLEGSSVEIVGDTVEVAGDSKVGLEGGGARTVLQGGRAAVN